jgi:O-methyltransferase
MNVCLAALMPRMAPGGVIIVDDYYAWDGCAKSVHEHLAGLKKQLRVRQFLNGPCYVVNE